MDPRTPTERAQEQQLIAFEMHLISVPWTVFRPLKECTYKEFPSDIPADPIPYPDIQPSVLLPHSQVGPTSSTPWGHTVAVAVHDIDRNTSSIKPNGKPSSDNGLPKDSFHPQGGWEPTQPQSFTKSTPTNKTITHSFCSKLAMATATDPRDAARVGSVEERGPRRSVNHSPDRRRGAVYRTPAIPGLVIKPEAGRKGQERRLPQLSACASIAPPLPERDPGQERFFDRGCPLDCPCRGKCNRSSPGAGAGGVADPIFTCFDRSGCASRHVLSIRGPFPSWLDMPEERWTSSGTARILIFRVGFDSLTWRGGGGGCGLLSLG
jgi:hypothetical protein